jgi:hypothetical protein
MTSKNIFMKTIIVKMSEIQKDKNLTLLPKYWIDKKSKKTTKKGKK